jgi:RNA polymerase sigma factor (sigma-70 family)
MIFIGIVVLVWAASAVRSASILRALTALRTAFQRANSFCDSRFLLLADATLNPKNLAGPLHCGRRQLQIVALRGNYLAPAYRYDATGYSHRGAASVADELSSVDAKAELASNLSIAFLVVLERLTPEERAAFLLREVFESDYSEIAQVLGKSEAACRQIASRARRHVHEQKPRVEVSDVARKALLDRLVQAIMTHDKNALLSLFANEASWTSDGGGKAKAALRIIRGRERVARFVLAVLGRHTDQFVADTSRIAHTKGFGRISTKQKLRRSPSPSR